VGQGGHEPESLALDPFADRDGRPGVPPIQLGHLAGQIGGAMVQVEISIDVVCPWCYIRKRQFETALARFPFQEDVDVVFRSFELDPLAPERQDLPLIELMKRKYSMSDQQAWEVNDRITSTAAQVGLEYHLLDAKRGNTVNVHRLIHLAGTHGVADAMEERLMAVYFTESQPIGDLATLQRLAVEVGLDPDEVAAVLGGDVFASDVRSDEQRARDLGGERRPPPPDQRGAHGGGHPAS
jgi:predicted DsbA family dithiol-disulfide isomerase